MVHCVGREFFLIFELFLIVFLCLYAGMHADIGVCA